MAKMNPNYPQPRGCWLEKINDEDGNVTKVILHDYPTWRLENGDYVVSGENKIENSKVEFSTVTEAETFASEEKYVICSIPMTPEERAAWIAKFSAYDDSEE